MALPDVHTGMPIIKMEIETEGIYASAALSDMRCGETDQGLTLPPEIQSSNVWRFDPAHAITDEEFEAIYGPLNREARRSSSPIDQAWLESLFRDDLETPEPRGKGRKASCPPRATRASSLRIDVTVFPTVSDIGQAPVSSNVPAHSSNDSGYGTSIAELCADGSISREPQTTEEMPQQEAHDVLATIHSPRSNITSHAASQLTIDRSIADDMFGGDFDSDPRDEEALYCQDDQHGLLDSRGRGDDAVAARESPLPQVMPTDPDIPIPSIETQDEEEHQTPLTITSIPSKSRPKKPRKAPGTRKHSPVVKSPKLPSWSRKFVREKNGQLQDEHVLPISLVALDTTNGEFSTHENSLPTATPQESTQHEVGREFVSQYPPSEVPQSSTFPDSQLPSPAAQQHQNRSQSTNLNPSPRLQLSHLPTGNPLQASPASITMADHGHHKPLLPSIGKLMLELVLSLPTQDTQTLLDPRVTQTVDTLINDFKNNLSARTSIAKALAQHVMEHLAGEVVGNGAHHDFNYDEQIADNIIEVAHLLINGGIIADPETSTRSNAPDVGQAHAVDVNATTDSELQARFTAISELVQKIRDNSLYDDTEKLCDQLEKSITNLAKECRASVAVGPQAQNHDLGFGGNNAGATYMTSNSTITLPSPDLEINRLREEMRQLRATQQTLPNTFRPSIQKEQHGGFNNMSAYTSPYASSYDASLQKEQYGGLNNMSAYASPYTSSYDAEQLNQSAQPFSTDPVSYADSPESQSLSTFGDGREYSEGPDGMIGWFCGLTSTVRQGQCLTFNHYKSKPKDPKSPAPIRKKCQVCKINVPEDKKFIVNRASFRNGKAVIVQQAVVNQVQPRFTPPSITEAASRKRKGSDGPESSDASKKKKSSGGFEEAPMADLAGEEEWEEFEREVEAEMEKTVAGEMEE